VRKNLTFGALTEQQISVAVVHVGPGTSADYSEPLFPTTESTERLSNRTRRDMSINGSSNQK